MIDRRTMVAAGLALGIAPRGRAAPIADGKRSAIDAIALPAGFNGAIGYGRRGRIAYLRTVGMADVEAGVPVTAATRYKWGSATKWLTSVAALRLVERGQLSLDGTVIDYLPDFRRDTGRAVRLAHLLSNTSGLPDLLTRQVAQEPALRTSSASPAAMVARFGGGDLSFAPGAGWDYSAFNWVIVAAILERLTGERLAELVTRLVLGMTEAGFAQADQPAMPQLAMAYSAGIPPVRKAAPVPPFLAASGNAAGSAQAAVRAAHGIFHGALLSPASHAALTRVRWPEQDYALGGRVRAIDGIRWAWETGKVGGYRTHIAHRLDRSETIVVFNTTDMDQEPIGGWVERIARA